MTEENRPSRQDDTIVLEVQQQVKELEKRLESITAMQNHMISEISLEADDHKFIKGRVADVTAKLNGIEKSISELKDDKIARSLKIEQIFDKMGELSKNLDHMHGCIKAMKTGEHAAVHKWAEEKMEDEKTHREFKKKIYELLVTRAVGAIVLVVFTLIGLGIVSWIRSISSVAP